MPKSKSQNPNSKIQTAVGFTIDIFVPVWDWVFGIWNFRLWILGFGFWLIACHRQDTLFRLVPAAHSGIDFNNAITDSDSLNILNFEYIYNGGGVAIADFNSDSLPDIYFTGNMVPNRLYLNEGGLRFKDVTATAGVAGSGKWSTGVAVIDINNDSRPDLYVCASMQPDSGARRNMLFVNQGPGTDGIPRFREMAKEYGIDDAGHSVMGAFFDYDNDGDLDLYVLTNQIDSARYPSKYKPRTLDGSNLNTDRLYRNDWSDSLQHPLFTNVSRQAGILIEGYGLGLNIADINRDGWKDIYVANDYLTNDILYINNRNGTFTDRSAAYYKHTAYSAMGTDINDINNDGLADIICLDMLPENNLRKKMMMNANNYFTYINNDQYGYQHQYPRNMLQLNCGTVPGPDSIPAVVFSDIGFLAGIAQTDWSWAPMVVDFDNDGFRDVLITNGFPRDITDHDFVSFRAMATPYASTEFMLEQIPRVKISNYAFRNNGDLTFSDVTAQWGMQLPSFSNGAAYADLDRDGDLDYVVNNIDDAAFVYENRGRSTARWLRIQWKGPPANRQALGAWVEIAEDGTRRQVYENTIYRGYLSSVENVAHFGLGGTDTVQAVKVTWPDGKVQVWRNVAANQVLTADYAAASPAPPQMEKPVAPLFADAGDSCQVTFKHAEFDYIDFNDQKLLPHKFSQYGPALAVGDVDGNGLDDIFIGGATQHHGVFLLQFPGEGFVQKDLLPGLPDGKGAEDMGCLLLDVDGDDDLDLYIASGSCENRAGSFSYRDCLYLNNGYAGFTDASRAVPAIHTSKSCVKAADFDRDGDLDLFVGGRVEPGKYPAPVSSYLLRNDTRDGTVQFTDITAQAAPALQQAGLVCDALWTDYDNDGWMDLLLAGEWMSPVFLHNKNGKFEPAATGMDTETGWWSSLLAGDFDNDGDMDYIAGNTGLNTLYRASSREPVSIYAADFDRNGSYDAVPVLYLPDSAGRRREFPAHTRDDLIKQMIMMRARFPKYHDFAVATIREVLKPEELQQALHLQAANLRSCYWENRGKGRFTCHPLPVQAQLAPVYGMLAADVNGDGNLDVVINGNDFGTDVSLGRYDALNGLVLLGNGKGGFTPADIRSSGIYIPGDGKALVQLKDRQGRLLLAASQNQGPLKVFRQQRRAQVLPLRRNDAWATVYYADGHTQKQEFAYGQSFLSQSGRYLSFTASVNKVDITDYSGNKRTLTLP
ncbi:VCBS repeat protein [Chitinophaga japonensis]|uniref:VCBS repeat protein n=1 Tax=Chitinophaga japonensis TaxID=104662 RepID=A0A562TCJ2_CHIJA|nr:VCBS repeat protein [Chitinophaga japonensis]